MIESALAILTASLLGSVHCAGMCGAFVCFYTGSEPSAAHTHTAKPALLAAHAMYNLGRLTTYLVLGAFAGAFGAGITQAGALAGVGNGAAVLAGVLMIAWGAHRIATLNGVRMPSFGGGPIVAWLQKVLGVLLLRVHAQPVSMRAFLTGTVTTLLPCGWLYVFVVAAGGTGSAAHGMLLMFVFWLGNVPALLAVAAGAQRAFGPLQRTLPTVSAVVVVALGLFSVIGHLQTGSMAMQHAH